MSRKAHIKKVQARSNRFRFKCRLFFKHFPSLAIFCLVLTLSACSQLPTNLIGPKKFSEYLSEANDTVKSGGYDKAEELYKQAIRAAQEKYGKEDPRLINCTVPLAELYKERQDYAQAATAFRIALQIYDKVAPGSPDAVHIRQEYKVVEQKIKKYNLEPVDEKMIFEYQKPKRD